MKKQISKNKIIFFIYGIIVILFSFILYVYNGEKIELKKIIFENEIVSIEFIPNNNYQDYVLEYSNNVLFLNSKKIYVSGTEISLSNIALKNNVLYVRIKSCQNEQGIHYIKSYKLINHTHIFVRAESLTVQPKCNENGYYIDICQECDSMENIIIDKLGCDMHIVEYKEATCTQDGYALWRCQRCGIKNKVIYPMIEHGFIFTKIIKDSTCTEQGKSLYNCVLCNKEKIETIDYKPHNYVYTGEFASDSSVGISMSCLYCKKEINKIYSKQYLGNFQGMLHIPNLSITVPVYSGNPSQLICDAINSASLQLFSLGIKDIIADHYYQGGFANIRNAKIGSTILYYQGNKYVCSENYNGINTKQILINDSGLDIRYGSSDIYLYTCNDRYGVSIRIVGWSKI